MMHGQKSIKLLSVIFDKYTRFVSLEKEQFFFSKIYLGGFNFLKDVTTQSFNIIPCRRAFF